MAPATSKGFFLSGLKTLLPIQAASASPRLDGHRSSRTYVASWMWAGSRNSGMACMALSSLSYSVMGLLVKLLASRGFPSSEVVLFRCAIIAASAAWALRSEGHPLLGRPAVRHLVVLRGIVGYLSLATYFHSIQLLPLTDATALNFTMPLFTALLATVTLGEPWRLREIMGAICSFGGVALVTRPGMLFGGPKANEAHASQASSERGLGLVCALVGASTGALSYIIVRAVGKRGEPPMVCVFSFAAFSLPMAMGGVLLQGVKVPDFIEFLGLVGVGGSALAAQVFLTRGLQLESAARATAMQYLKVLGTYFLGVIFLRESPTLEGLLGACLIVGSAISMTVSGSH